MKVLSVNVGLPQEITVQGKPVWTGIFKQPVAHRVAVSRLNLDGDRQADLQVHGGPDKAVYAYPSDHYGFWRDQLPDLQLPYGMFGENLTVAGLREDQVHIGDRFAVGSAELQVTQPRLPCYKLGIRFGRADMVKRFLNSRRTGFYFRVTREGEIGAGDPVARTFRDPGGVSVAEITRLYAFDRDDRELLARILASEALPQDWHDYFLNQGAAIGA